MKLTEILRDRQNCLQVTPLTCNKCGFILLANGVGANNCPHRDCDGTLEAEQPIVIGRVTCTHEFNTDGHAYVPKE